MKKVIDWYLFCRWIWLDRKELEPQLQEALIEWLTDFNLKWFLGLNKENQRRALKGSLPSRLVINYHDWSCEELLSINDIKEINEQILPYLNLSTIDQLKLLNDYLNANKLD